MFSLREFNELQCLFHSLNLEMGFSASFPSSISCCRKVSKSFPFVHEAAYSRNFSLNLKPNQKYPLQTVYIDFHVSHSPLSYQALIEKSLSSRRRGHSQVPFSAGTTAPAEEDHRALEAVLKLYTEMKNKNIQELSNIIADECRCVCNFISDIQTFHGKEQVLGLFSYLIESLGNHIEFTVQPAVLPTWHNGFNVSVSWKLRFKDTRVPLGKGSSFHILHEYKGKLLISHVEMFMEPLLHIEPFRLKVMGFVTTVMDKMGSNEVFKGKVKRAVYILLSLVSMAALLFFIKRSL